MTFRSTDSAPLSLRNRYSSLFLRFNSFGSKPAPSPATRADRVALALVPPISQYASRPCFENMLEHSKGYTPPMGNPPVTPNQVGILVLDDDAQGAGAVRQILDSEGWRVRIVTDAKLLLSELKTGEWSLVIANIALTGLDSHTFITLRELASVSAEEGGRIRVLYL